MGVLGVSVGEHAEVVTVRFAVESEGTDPPIAANAPCRIARACGSRCGDWLALVEGEVVACCAALSNERKVNKLVIRRFGSNFMRTPRNCLWDRLPTSW